VDDSIVTVMTVAASLALGAAVALYCVSLVPFWDDLSMRYLGPITSELSALGFDAARLDVYMRLWGAALVATAMFFGVLERMVPVAVMATYFIYVSPRFVIEELIQRRRHRFRDQMVIASGAIANTVRAGESFAEAIRAVGQDSAEPLSLQFRKIWADFNRGRPLQDAIMQIKNRLQVESFTLFSHAVCTCLERGGNVSEALDRIAYSLQENQRIERKLEADTASGRKVVVILGAFPFVFLAGFYMLDPSSTGLLFTTFIGQLVFVVVVVIVYLAVLWCRKILAIDKV
jgi:tight adherence protein B